VRAQGAEQRLRVTRVDQREGLRQRALVLDAGREIERLARERERSL